MLSLAVAPRHRVRASLPIAAVTLVLGLLLPAVSHADNYVINNGPSAPTPNSSVGPWTVIAGLQGSKTTWSLAAGDYIGPLGSSMNVLSTDAAQVSAPA